MNRAIRPQRTYFLTDKYGIIKDIFWGESIRDVAGWVCNKFGVKRTRPIQGECAFVSPFNKKEKYRLIVAVVV
jgi:hypothetical protein